jgi:hypothetical protein
MSTLAIVISGLAYYKSSETADEQIRLAKRQEDREIARDIHEENIREGSGAKLYYDDNKDPHTDKTPLADGSPKVPSLQAAGEATVNPEEDD